MRGMRDAVPVPRDGLEAVIHTESRVSVVLQLLQHRIGQPRQKRIPAEKQHRQPVGVRKSCRRVKVRRPRPSTRRAEHEPLPKVVLGVGRCREPHRLLVLTPIERERVLVIIERLAQAGHIAMAKNTKTPAADARAFTVNFDELSIQPTDDRLCRRQTNGVGHAAVPPQACSFRMDNSWVKR